ncbi:MAG TPA: mandelate racemase/muconate lactonizing enzyme family protein [Bryobacteraceae bacterium]|nr:mandelate racemase/muconate lactonizing enzyme family protein [Bryobacteraceae bacterium]
MPARTSRRAFLAQAAVTTLGAESRQKIVSVKAAPLPLLSTARFGTKEFTSDHDPARHRWFGPFSQLAGSILVQIRTDQGITGYGMGGGGTAAIHIIDTHLKDLLIGANASNIDLLWEQLFHSTSFYGRRGVPIMAISGIDLALWDIAGKVAGQPVWRLLGGAAREKVTAYYTGADMERGVALGFQAFKMGLFESGGATGKESMFRVIAALEKARGIIGPDAKLMIDCLCRWNVEHTLEFAKRAAGLNLYFIEEPLFPDDVAGYQRLCREITGTRIACGEHEFTRFGFQEIIRNQAAHILQPDLTWGGGLSDARQTATIAAAHGLPVMPHRGGSLFGIHLVVSHPNCPMAESFGTGEPGNEMMELLTPRFANGYYFPPEKPGMGLNLNPALLKKHVPALQ